MRLTEQVHQFLRESVCEGNTVIDATAGNGHDTLFLADLVGRGGKVFSIDIQSSAIKSTRSRLTAARAIDQCELIQGDHAETLKELSEQHSRTISAITFNLGYLPGSDKSVTTYPETTLRALDTSLNLLNDRGLLLVTAYRGHSGGMSEAKEVESWMRDLSNSVWSVESREPRQQRAESPPPILWLVRRT